MLHLPGIHLIYWSHYELQLLFHNFSLSISSPHHGPVFKVFLVCDISLWDHRTKLCTDRVVWCCTTLVYEVLKNNRIHRSDQAVVVSLYTNCVFMLEWITQSTFPIISLHAEIWRYRQCLSQTFIFVWTLPCVVSYQVWNSCDNCCVTWHIVPNWH
jgi:hypothetical protein